MTNYLRRATILIIWVGMIGPVMVRAQDAAEKPKLSEEIERVLSEEGPEAAKARFDEIFPAMQDEYVVDANAFATLGTQYMQNGDVETGMLFIQMVGTITAEAIKSAQDAFDASGMAPPEVEETMGETEEPVSSPPSDRGPARTDLTRFAGFYGTPEQAEENRMLFVTESCDGYLVVGAVWGDAENWWMRSEGDNAFSYSSQYTNIHMEFDVDDNGNAKAMIHDLDFMPSPLPKHQPLPEEWRACVRPEGG
ncbi:MAG: hypothetical protein WBW88_13280 [Rhodothermales bacterium]